MKNLKLGNLCKLKYFSIQKYIDDISEQAITNILNIAVKNLDNSVSDDANDMVSMCNLSVSMKTRKKRSRIN